MSLFGSTFFARAARHGLESGFEPYSEGRHSRTSLRGNCWNIWDIAANADTGCRQDCCCGVRQLTALSGLLITEKVQLINGDWPPSWASTFVSAVQRPMLSLDIFGRLASERLCRHTIPPPTRLDHQVPDSRRQLEAPRTVITLSLLDRCQRHTEDAASRGRR